MTEPVRAKCVSWPFTQERSESDDTRGESGSSDLHSTLVSGIRIAIEAPFSQPCERPGLRVVSKTVRVGTRDDGGE